MSRLVTNTQERGPLARDEFVGGEATVKPKLEQLGFGLIVGSETQGASSPRAWWVNQGSTYEFERAGG